jgi:predicted secreted Zn-dependent protease
MRRGVRRARALTLTLACLCASSALARDSRIIHESFVYYDVSGTSIPEILQSLVTNRPASARGYLSLTTFYFEPAYKYIADKDAAGNDICRVFNGAVTIDIDILIPRHLTISQAPQEVQDKWNAFIAATRMHELHHAKDSIETGFKIPDALDALVAPDCDALQKAATVLNLDYLAQGQKLGDDYDVLTNHGLKDGAILQ